MAYRNSEGYSDPCAGEALGRITRESRIERKTLDRKERQKDYDRLCRHFRKVAREYGFEFPGQIWLRSKKSGCIFKDG